MVHLMMDLLSVNVRRMWRAIYVTGVNLDSLIYLWIILKGVNVSTLHSIFLREKSVRLLLFHLLLCICDVNLTDDLKQNVAKNNYL